MSTPRPPVGWFWLVPKDLDLRALLPGLLPFLIAIWAEMVTEFGAAFPNETPPEFFEN